MTNYQQILKEVKSLKCEVCQGLGAIDYTESEGTSFEEATCPKCYGTGWNDALEFRKLEII